MEKNFTELGNVKEEGNEKVVSWKSPDCYGSGFIKRIEIRPGMTLNFYNWRLNDDIRLALEDQDGENEDGFIGFNYCISGLNDISINKMNTDIVLQRGFDNITIAGHSLSTTMAIPKKIPNSIVSVQLTPDCFRSLLSDELQMLPGVMQSLCEGNIPDLFIRTMPSIPQTRIIVEQLLNGISTTRTSRLFYEGQVLTLIAYMVRLLDEKNEQNNVHSSFRANDIERLHYAREMLARNVSNPPTLSELSHAAGMNHFKLNRGFKEVFGNTVFGQLRQIRLEKAKKLLMKGEMNVTEVSLTVGYSCLSHFAKVFKQQYGVNPKAYLKRVSPVMKVD